MTTRIRKPKEIDTTDKIRCTRCKVWKTKDDFSLKKKEESKSVEPIFKKYCNHCLYISTAYRNKKKTIRVNIHNLSDEEKKEIFNEVNNISE